MLNKFLLISIVFIMQNSFAQQSEAVSADSSTAEQVTVNQNTERKVSRDYVLYPSSGLNFILGQVFKPKNGTQRDDKGYSVYLKGAKNFGRFELGPSYYISYSESGTVDNSDKNQYFGIFVKYNFIENKPGEKLIPFLKAEYTIGETSVTNAAVETTISNSKYYITAGVEYFPLNDYLAIDFGLISSTRTYDNKKNSNDYEYTGLELSADFKVYF